MGKAHHGREVGQIQRAGVHELHLVVVGQACNDGFVGKLYIDDGCASGEEVARCAGV